MKVRACTLPSPLASPPHLASRQLDNLLVRHKDPPVDEVGELLHQLLLGFRLGGGGVDLQQQEGEGEEGGVSEGEEIRGGGGRKRSR